MLRLKISLLGATDVAGGSEFGYSLLWVLLFSNLMALTLQVLASRIGIVTSNIYQWCHPHVFITFIQ